MRKIFPLFLMLVTLPLIAKEPVTAKLVANHEVIAKGEPFLLGIQLTMNDHWHTYWENPGFAGQPATWQLEEVEGLEIGELKYPWPKEWTDDQGFISYGYDDKALVYATATYSGDASEITIKGKFTWIACKDICIPGNGQGELKLQVGEPKLANEKEFNETVAATPVPYNPEMPFTYTSKVDFQPTAWSAEVTVTLADSVTLAEGESVVLYPFSTNDMAEMKTLDLKREGNTLHFELNYEAFEENVPEDFRLGAALKLQTTDKTIYARLPFGSETEAQETDSAQVNTPTETQNQGFLYFMLLAFLGGLILNLMPCVLPVLSLKVFGLLQEVGESTSRRIAYGWAYTLGIVVCFNIISGFFAGAKLAGTQLGVGFQFQNPIFVISISTLIFVMGLSFLGVFHIGQPTNDKLAELSTKGGLKGAFFNGALMTILSTPCTAPLLGAAYAWALSQSVAIIFVSFNVIAFGLAFPYLVLCYFPALLKFLPKPGPWMETFKIGMGFMMMATLVWLFSVLIDLTGTSGMIGMLTFLLCLSAALLIYGQTWHSDSRKKGAAYMTLLIVVGSYLGFVKLFDIANPTAAKEKKMEELRIKFLSEDGGSGLMQLLENQVTTADEIKWVHYNPKNLEHFRNQDRLIFVDYTAAWCLTCKANERGVIDTQSIRELFADNNVVVMKADYTDKSDELTLDLKKFNRAGVPMYLVYPGKGEPILLPEMLTKGIVQDAVAEAQGLLQQQAKK